MKTVLIKFSAPTCSISMDEELEDEDLKIRAVSQENDSQQKKVSDT